MTITLARTAYDHIRTYRNARGIDAGEAGWIAVDAAAIAEFCCD